MAMIWKLLQNLNTTILEICTKVLHIGDKKEKYLQINFYICVGSLSIV